MDLEGLAPIASGAALPTQGVAVVSPAKRSRSEVAPLLHAPTDVILTPRNAPVVERIGKHLGALLEDTASPQAPFYAAIREVILESIELADTAKRNGYEQNAVAHLVDRYTHILTFPGSYLSGLADRVDSGMDSCLAYDAAYHAELFAHVSKYFRANAEPTYRDAFAKRFMADLRVDRHTPSASIRLDGFYENDEWKRDLYFQYRYLYLDGERELMEFVELRESDTVIIGTPDAERADYDTQHATAKGFVRHDYAHAYLQKLMDARLFDSLGVATLTGARQVRGASAQCLDELLGEWRSLPDMRMRTAIEIILFGAMHEEALSYPVQVAAELGREEQAKRHVRILGNLLSQGRLGEARREILGDDAPELLQQALEWVRARATEHAPVVRRVALQASLSLATGRAAG